MDYDDDLEMFSLREAWEDEQYERWNDQRDDGCEDEDDEDDEDYEGPDEWDRSRAEWEADRAADAYERYMTRDW